MMMFASLSVATECAYLLSGDEKYLNLLRNQIDLLMKRSITTEEGQVLVPYRRNQEGWHSYRPMMIRDLTHLWHASMDEEDWDKIEAVRKGQKFRPLNGEGIWGQNTLDHLDTIKYKPSEPFDWKKEMIQGDRTMGKSEYARLMYYAGENPDWPLKALKADYQEMTNRMEFMRNDPRAIKDINKDDTYPNNPVILKALQQTTMGTPQTLYFGGLSRGTVRYYDLAGKRPGLPSDVSALVEKLEDEMVAIRLVNLSLIESKDLIIQAGVFGEHQFTTILYNESPESKIKPVEDQKKSQEVRGKYVKIILPPSTSILLEIGLDRFSNDPSYRFPWDGIIEN
jgi:hypothetical protein